MGETGLFAVRCSRVTATARSTVRSLAPSTARFSGGGAPAGRPTTRYRDKRQSRARPTPPVHCARCRPNPQSTVNKPKTANPPRFPVGYCPNQTTKHHEPRPFSTFSQTKASRAHGLAHFPAQRQGEKLGKDPRGVNGFLFFTGCSAPDPPLFENICGPPPPQSSALDSRVMRSWSALPTGFPS